MGLKKLSITDEQAEQVRELLEKKLSPYKISKKLKIPQATLWRNMEFMGLNKKKVPKPNKPKKKVVTQYFRWSDYGNSLVI